MVASDKMRVRLRQPSQLRAITRRKEAKSECNGRQGPDQSPKHRLSCGDPYLVITGISDMVYKISDVADRRWYRASRLHNTPTWETGKRQGRRHSVLEQSRMSLKERNSPRNVPNIIWVAGKTWRIVAFSRNFHCHINLHGWDWDFSGALTDWLLVHWQGQMEYLSWESCYLLLTTDGLLFAHILDMLFNFVSIQV
jgi:hypothetical protein